MARQRRIVGAVLRVDFAPGWHTYALTLTDAEFAFFDAATQAELPAAEVVRRPVLFRWCVYNDFPACDWGLFAAGCTGYCGTGPAHRTTHRPLVTPERGEGAMLDIVPFTSFRVTPG